MDPLGKPPSMEELRAKAEQIKDLPSERALLLAEHLRRPCQVVVSGNVHTIRGFYTALAREVLEEMKRESNPNEGAIGFLEAEIKEAEEIARKEGEYLK